jgi:hypothetical protein
MKLFNPSEPFVVISWAEFRKLLEHAPVEVIDKLLAEVGCKPSDYKPEEKIGRLFIELEEQL